MSDHINSFVVLLEIKRLARLTHEETMALAHRMNERENELQELLTNEPERYVLDFKINRWRERATGRFVRQGPYTDSNTYAVEKALTGKTDEQLYE